MEVDKLTEQNFGDVFSCRVVNIDSVLMPPIQGLDPLYSVFSEESIKKVPIIRIFGATPRGQKVVRRSLTLALKEGQDHYLKQFGQSIDHALQVSLGVGSKEDKHVFQISIIKGFPFYGYHATESTFLKIELYSPSHIKRLAELLLAGAIMNVPLQAHESHIPFVLQFMIDNNLYGMNYINCSKVMFRIGGDETKNDFQSSGSPAFTNSPTNTCHHQTWKIKNIPIDMMLYEARVSTCELEVDVGVQYILNRQDLCGSIGEYPGLVSLWEEELKRRTALSIEDDLSPPPSPDRTCPMIHEAEERHRHVLFDIIDKRCSTSPAPDLTPPIETDDQSLSVDEDIIDYRMKLSRKLSSVSFNSSEAELVDVLADLVQSSDLNQTLTLSQSYSQYENILPNIQNILPNTQNISQTTGNVLAINERVSTSGGSESDLFEDKNNENNLTIHDTSLPSFHEHETNVSLLQKSIEKSNIEDNSILSQLLLSQTNFTQHLEAQSQPYVTSTQLSYQDRKHLIQLCMSSNDDEQEEIYQEEEEEEENEEDEEAEMTQPFIDDTRSNLRDTISQLDGTHDRSRKRSLGLSRRKTKKTAQSESTESSQPELKPAESSKSELKPESSQSKLKLRSSQPELKPESSQSKLKLRSSQPELKPESSQSKLKLRSSQPELKPAESSKSELKPESSQSKLKLRSSQPELKPESSQSKLKLRSSQPELKPESSQSKLKLRSSQPELKPESSQSGWKPELLGTSIKTKEGICQTKLEKNRKRSRSATLERDISECSSNTCTPPSVLATRARNSSLFPKIPKMSREDSEKYLAAMKRQKEDTPCQGKSLKRKRLSTHKQFPNSSSKHSPKKSSIQSSVSSSEQFFTHSPVLFSRRSCTRSVKIYNYTSMDEDKMLSLAMAESLRTLEMEQKKSNSDQENTNVKHKENDQEEINDKNLENNAQKITNFEQENDSVANLEEEENNFTNLDQKDIIKAITSLDPEENINVSGKNNVCTVYQDINLSQEENSTTALLCQEENSAALIYEEDSNNVTKLEHDSVTNVEQKNKEIDIDEMEVTNYSQEMDRSFFIQEPEPYTSDDNSSPFKLAQGDSTDISSEFQLVLSSESDCDEPCTSLEEPGLLSSQPRFTSGTVSWPIKTSDKCILQPQLDPPTLHTDSIRHRKPFYSNPLDAQPPQDYGGYKVCVPSLMPYELPEFDCSKTNSNNWCTLEHWQTVLAMHNGKTSILPSCLPDKGGNKEPFTAQRHQEVITSRSQYWPNSSCIISPLKSPPDPFTIKNELQSHSFKLQTPSDDNSHLDGPSLDNTYGFQFTPSSITDTTTDTDVQFITQMSVEVHVRTRAGLRPDPEWDSVLALFYFVHNDWPAPDGHNLTGIIAINLSDDNIQTTPTKGKSPAKTKSPIKVTTPQKYKGSPQKYKGSPQKYKGSPQKYKESPSKNLIGDVFKKSVPEVEDLANSTDNDVVRPYLEHCGLSTDLNITYVNSEKELFDELIKLIRDFDPDILLGYEIQKGSWGYLKSRSHFLGINLIGQIGRVPVTVTGKHSSRQHSSDVHVQGRIIINVWKTLRHEIALTRYTFENLSYHILHQRVPKFSYQTLTEWYEFRNRLYRSRVVDYYMTRCYGNFQLLDKLNLIGRTSEMARLYGIEFHNVLARGSQYRVESMMLRLAKQYNFIAVSPSVQQRARMSAPECLPLIMEPESKFYSDPVLVLDFQSLYPSMVIAYNYCYSTCLGRVKQLANDGDYVFGTCSLNISRHQLKQLKDCVTISPNGIVFVKPEVRNGVLPQMLEKILNTRIMVKQSMKIHKQNKILQRILDARQLSLKLIANVTYGYTGASYSGRMPCVEIADSIVRKGRETLERAIQLVNSTQKWRARVVYGDTDSMFVLLKGVTKEEAFRIGNEMSRAVTAINPKPVKLKFEKVYLPCILQTKKRYVGYSYESPNQIEPVFDAKGIETVRRDGCPLASKVLEKSLKLLFSTKDVSLVKSYVQHQCCKIMDGKVSLQNYVFAKEYRGHSGYRPGACVPALELAKKMVKTDRQAEPLVGERVPYVIVYDSPGLPLIQLVRRLDEVASNPSLNINTNYYITKQIMPPLDRSFALLGINVFQWYSQLPRTQRPLAPLPHATKRSGTISQYFSSLHCPICGSLTTSGICEECSRKPNLVAVTLSSHIQKAESSYLSLTKLCGNCCGNASNEYFLECISLDCPVFYSRQTSLFKLNNACSHQMTLNSFLSRL